MTRPMPDVPTLATTDIAERLAIRETIAAAAGTYDCPHDDGYFELFTDDSIEDFAALNRWLGHHGRCGTETDKGEQ